MRPIYFRMMAWSGKPYATSLEVSALVASGKSPTDVEDQVAFKVGYDGTAWHDVIMGESGVILLSESVKRAIESDGLLGATFVNAPIVEVLSSALRNKSAPRYYRLLARSLIMIDRVALNSRQRLIPVDTAHTKRSDFFFVDHPTGHLGYYCSYRALETFRRHKIKNFHITPLDYIR